VLHNLYFLFNRKIKNQKSKKKKKKKKKKKEIKNINIHFKLKIIMNKNINQSIILKKSNSILNKYYYKNIYIKNL